MELLLNLLWATLAAAAFFVGVRRRPLSSKSRWVSRFTTLLALGCVLVLLFPVVSASDDLQAAQALAEDAINRVPKSIAPLQQVKQFGSSSLLFPVLSLFLLFVLVRSGFRLPELARCKPLERQDIPRKGRSPPSFL